MFAIFKKNIAFGEKGSHSNGSESTKSVRNSRTLLPGLSMVSDRTKAWSILDQLPSLLLEVDPALGPDSPFDAQWLTIGYLRQVVML
jgi:hypothetical protein